MKHDVANIFKGTLTQIYAAVSGTLFIISDGMTVGWTAPMIPYLISEESHIKTTKQEAEWLESTLYLGALCGLPATLFFTEKIGRKKSLLLASFALLVVWTLIALADKMIYLFLARFIAGMAANMAFVAGPMYVAEIADQKIRGFLSNIILLMMLTGSLIVYCVGPFLPFYVPCVIGGLLSIIELAIFSLMPESPNYLLYKNKPDEAKRSLAFFRPNMNIDREIVEISKAIERQKSERGRPLDLLLVDSNRKALLIITVLKAGQNLSAITVVMMNLHIMLRAACSIYMEDSFAAILFAIILLLSTTIASFQLDNYGRKPLLIISALLTAISLLILAVYFNLQYVGYNVLPVSWIPIVTVMTYAATFNMGLGTVPLVLTAEVFPAKMKAIGMTVSDAMYVIWGIASLQIYQWLANSYGLLVPFYLFSACSVTIVVFTLFYIPETKGKTLEEIQVILKGQKAVPDISNTHENFTYK